MSKRMKPEERKKQIIKAAEKVAIRDGILNINTRSVAVVAGVHRGLIRHYFRTIGVLSVDVVNLKNPIISEQLKGTNHPLEALI